MMTASVKGPVSVTAATEDEDDLESALDLLGMVPLTGGMCNGEEKRIF